MKSFTLEHRIGIQAPAETVWEIVSNLKAWPSWNPYYSQFDVDLRIGAPAVITLTLPEREPQTVKGNVIDWIPYEQVHIGVKFVGSLWQATRYLEIDAVSKNACILANGDYHFGPLARFMPRPLKAKVRRVFEHTNEMIKQKAEAAFQTAQAAPISSEP
jgi:hypothetical protein